MMRTSLGKYTLSSTSSSTSNNYYYYYYATSNNYYYYSDADANGAFTINEKTGLTIDGAGTLGFVYPDTYITGGFLIFIRRRWR